MPAEVTIYTNPGCPHCQQLKQHLTRHQVAFTDRDVTHDPAAMDDLRRIDAPGVPVIRVGEEVLIGFNPDRLDAALRANGVAAHPPG